MKQISILLILGFGFSVTQLHSQGYQAIHGSPYAGSTGIFNNPAASVGSAYKWDLTLFSTQLKMSTNFLYLKNFTLSNQDSSYLESKEGNYSRFLHANLDINLMNVSYKIDNNKAFSLGLRARSYNHMKLLPYNYVDTINSVHSFLVANSNTASLQGFATHTGWLEADLNYSQVLFETNTAKLTGGVTVQIMKGISALFSRVNKLSYTMTKNATDTIFNFSEGNGSFGYSDNYDGVAGQTSAKDFIKNSKTAFGLSFGIEYLTYKTENGNNNVNYDWKIGVSLLDLGANTFKPSTNSSKFSNPDQTLTDTDLDNKFKGINSTSDLKDTLATIFTTYADITDNFKISNPTRLNINIDKNLGNNFYINGDLSMNFYASSSFTKFRTRELNLLTITPRWETLGWGAYLPVQYNTQGQLWVGAAVKLGPLVMGIHNLGLLKKDPMLNGGGYLLLSIHPFNKRNVLSKMDCPQ